MRPADPLAPFRADVLAARAKMDAATGYGPYRLAQGDYNEARETLAAAQYRLDPAASDAHAAHDAAMAADAYYYPAY